ncbi:MAG: type VI secretion system protein TssA [Spongiibacteraceae bacterium]
MASPSIINIDNLAQPISSEKPQGNDIRQDRSPNSDYYTIKDARNSARAAERANLFDDEHTDTLSLWKPVLNIAPQILINSSKDLEVLSWYIEALIRFYGFAGLRDGLKLTHRIIDDYWEQLYPLPDEDGLETKLAPLTGLNGDGGEGTLLTPIRNCVITTETGNGAFSYWQYQQARDTQKINDEDKRQNRFDSMGFSLANIEAAITNGATSFYIDLIEDLEACNLQYKTLIDLLVSHCGQEAPPSSNISDLLDEVLRSVRFLTKVKLAHINSADTPDNNTGTINNQILASQSASIVSGSINNRESALQCLQDVAAYFRVHEPHSPLAPAIERITGWGRMSVAELMMELVPDDSARTVLNQLTGMKLDGSDKRSYVAPLPATSTSAASPDESQETEEESNKLAW